MVLEQKILKFSSWKSSFSLCVLHMQWTGTIWTIIKESHIRIIPAKFGQNPESSLGGDVFWSNYWRHTTQVARRTSNGHNSSTWAKGSGELITQLLRKQRINHVKLDITQRLRKPEPIMPKLIWHKDSGNHSQSCQTRYATKTQKTRTAKLEMTQKLRKPEPFMPN